MLEGGTEPLSCYTRAFKGALLLQILKPVAIASAQNLGPISIAL
jgi:hypothetical protein